MCLQISACVKASKKRSLGVHGKEKVTNFTYFLLSCVYILCRDNEHAVKNSSENIFPLLFLGFIVTPDKAKVQVSSSLSSQAKEPWKILQFKSKIFYIPLASVFPEHIWDK